MIRRTKVPTPASLLVMVPFVLSGCVDGGRSIGPVPLTGEIVYREPASSLEPDLISARDIMAVADRLYVLDGRLARVAIFDTEEGAILGTFGGIGEGPGELGRFPHSLVTDGERVGVGHHFTVSWFTPEGVFLENETLPPFDLVTPSLQWSGGGWVFNAGWRGIDSPLAVWISPAGDTLGFGASVLPERTDAAGLALMELNAVHVARFGNGNVILGAVQQDRITLHAADGSLLLEASWPKSRQPPARKPDGRLRDRPGFTVSLAMGADDRATLIDGTLTRVRRYASDGTIVGEYELDRPVIGMIWTGPRTSWAIDGSDRLIRFSIAGDRSH